MAMKKCPVCGVSVKVENLERHVRNQHPREHVDLSQTLTEEDREAVERSKSRARPALTRTGKRTVLIAIIAVAVVLVVAIVATTWRPSGPNVGQNAPSFTLQTSDGSVVALSSLTGQNKPVFLEFMSPFCSACWAAAPTVSAIYGAFGSRVVFASVVWVNFFEGTATTANVTDFKTAHNTPWPYGMDYDDKVINAYGVSSTPTFFILSSSGVVQSKFVGAYPYTTLSNALNQALG